MSENMAHQSKCELGENGPQIQLSALLSAHQENAMVVRQTAMQTENHRDEPNSRLIVAISSAILWH